MLLLLIKKRKYHFFHVLCINAREERKKMDRVSPKPSSLHYINLCFNCACICLYAVVAMGYLWFWDLFWSFHVGGIYGGRNPCWPYILYRVKYIVFFIANPCFERWQTIFHCVEGVQCILLCDVLRISQNRAHWERVWLTPIEMESNSLHNYPFHPSKTPHIT